MENDEKKKVLEKITKELLEKMEIQSTVYIEENAVSEDNAISIEIQTSDSSYLIGRGGVNLSALQHIIRILTRKEIGEQMQFTVDVNGYRDDQRQIIIDRAQEVIEEVRNRKEAIELSPMNSYERRIVHMEVSKHSDIESESIGEEEERRVVIKSVN
ncbi:MAG: KH domain-containing protein [Patescibacteria group bacterium]|jgi:spoIIIJ-associated protein|nr:KH domain-containing protein [Patescibacteria group bacterium]